MFAHTKALQDRFLELGVPGNDIAVFRNGTCIFRRPAGFSDLEQTQPMTGSELFNFYSCTKAITCVAAMQLWEQGAFSLDDRLDLYMPEFSDMQVQSEHGVRPAEQPIRISQLFDMTAGFSYDVSSPQLLLAKEKTQGRCPTREVMTYLAKEPLLFEPGTQWNYSLCHDVIAALVEVISGQRFSDYVSSNIFEPLGMTRSTFFPSAADLEQMADQYEPDPATGMLRNCGKDIQYYQFGTEYESGGAGMVSCVDDYMKLLEALRIGDWILKKETIAMLAQDRVQCRLGDSPDLKNQGYGLGFRCRHANSSAWLTEFGWGGAAGAYYCVDIPRGLSVFYVQHVLGSAVHEIRSKVYETVLKDLGEL